MLSNKKASFRGGVGADPLPQTPGMLRALIAVRLELARQCHPDSQEHWRLQQGIADLERRLYALEQGIIDRAGPGMV